MSKRFEKWPKGAWSFSQFSKLMRCPREHNLSYVQGIRPIGNKSKALQVGDAYHVAHEHVCELCMTRNVYDDDYRDAITKARAVCGDPSAALECQRLLASYRLRWGDDNAGWGDYKILGVEEVVVAEHLHKDIGGYAAIADLVVADPSGKKWVVERKTASRMHSGTDKEIIRHLRTRPQLKDLALCARDTFKEDVGVIYDLTTKTSTVGFLRVAIEFTSRELEEWEQWHTAMEAMVGLSCPNPNSCDPPVGWRCDFYDYCHGTDEDRAVLYTLKRKPT